MEVRAEKSWGSGGMKEENQEAARGGGQALAVPSWGRSKTWGRASMARLVV